jgi:plastocyanin
MITTKHTVSWINKGFILSYSNKWKSEIIVGTIFESSLIKSGNSFSHTFTKEGICNCCAVHRWQTGKVIVKQGAQ